MIESRDFWISAILRQGIGAGGKRIPRLIDNTHLVLVATQSFVVVAITVEDLEEVQATPFAIAILTRQHVAATRAEKRQVLRIYRVAPREMVI